MSPMEIAFQEARAAAAQGEVPVGAVLLAADGTVLARAGNAVEARADAAAHAELLVLRAAAALRGEPRLPDCDLVVTLEPCPMCAQAISLFRIRRLVFGAYDPKSGGVEHGARVFDAPSCHHRPEVIGGVREAQSAALLREFFHQRREVPAIPAPPPLRSAYRTIEMHTAGEPVRIVVEGFPEPHGASVLQKRADAMARLDVHRRRLMLEPRGHTEMYGALPVTSSLPGAAVGVLFMHHSGFSTMCGHATIALGRWAVESGRVPLRDGRADFVLECPCGPVDVHVTEWGARVAFDSVPAFAAALDLAVAVPGYGQVVCDIGYGGAFYAILPATQLGIDLRTDPIGRQRAAARAVTDAIRASHTVRHPQEADLGFLYGTILTDGAPPDEISHNLCVFGEGQIDRSPTGSGVTARLAVEAARGLVRPGETRQFSGPTGVPFAGELIEQTRVADLPAFRVRVSGSAFHSGEATFVVEADDALADGFALEDDALPPLLAAGP